MVLLYWEEFGGVGEEFMDVLGDVLTPAFNTYQEKYMPPTWIGGGACSTSLSFHDIVYKQNKFNRYHFIVILLRCT